MDILNIDEILNSDCSSGFFDEDNQEDVINILQQWKNQGMRDTTPNKPDTRTFTRVKQKLFNNYYNKFDNENENEKKQNDFDFNKTIEYNNELYDYPNEQHISNTTFLNDISPPVSSSFMLDKGNYHQQQQLNRSLINSDHFQNIDFLNSIDSDLNIERTFQLNSSAVSLSQSSSSTPPPQPASASASTSTINNHLYNQFDDNNDKIKYHNDEIFNTLSMSGTKDFNIAQTDTDESQLNILSTNSSTTESTSDENIHYQKSSFINNHQQNHEHDPHHTFTKEESNLIKEKFLRSNKFFDNNYDLELTYNIENDHDADLNMKTNINHSKLLDNETFINNKLSTPTVVFSDKTFKKKPKIQKSFQLHEHNIVNNFVDFADDMDDFENIEMVINELHLDDSKNNLNTSCNETDEHEHDEQNDFLLHSTPFQISNRKIKNSTEKWSNLISRHLNYDDDNIINTITDDDNDDDDCIKKNINCIPNYNKRFESFTKDDLDKEIDCFVDDIKINDNFKDYQDIIDDVEIDNDYDNGKDFNTTSTIKMKQSLDNIKRKHFSQKQQNDKKSSNDQNNTTSSNKKTYNCSPINSNRLLIRRSRLFEPNLEQNSEKNLQKNIKMSCSENEMKQQKTIFDNKQDILLGCNENENSSEYDDNNYCQSKNQNQLNTTVIFKTNKDLNIQQNNLKQENNLEISCGENNKKFVESTQQQQQHQENDNQNVFKEPTTVAIKSIKSNNASRMLQRPKYVTRYLKQQNSDNFYKANSAGDLSKTTNQTSDLLLGEKQNNHTMENNTGNKNGAGGTKISYKAKSFHNLAVGCSNIVGGTGTGTSADEINLLEPIRHENHKTAVEKSLIPNINCGDKITNNRSSVPFKSRLIRPTSGYYGSDVRNHPASLGFQQNLHVMNNAVHTDKKHFTNSSSSTNSTSSIVSNISETNLTKNNVKKVIQQSTTVPIPTSTSTAAAAITTTNNNKSVLRVKRSGLPRPSSVIRR